MKYFEDEWGVVVSIGELYDEFEMLRKLDPEEYNYEFEQYVDNCIGQNGTLTPVEVKQYTYDTLWTSVKDSLQKFLNIFGIEYDLKPISNLFWRFEITATEAQKNAIISYIKGVAA